MPKKTLATPSRCRGDVAPMIEFLIEALEIPLGMINTIKQNGYVGSGRFGTCNKVYLHGTIVCAKMFQSSSVSSRSLVLHEAAMLLKVRHPNVAFLIGIQT